MLVDLRETVARRALQKRSRSNIDSTEQTAIKLASMNASLLRPGHPKTKMRILVFLLVPLTSVALADDFKTLNGKEYKDVTVTRVEPDGIVVTSKSGISKIYFTELPKDVQQHFGYDSQKAGDYSARQSAGVEQVRKQQEESSRQKIEASQKTEQYRAEQAAQQNSVRMLQARYEELQRREDNLLVQIGEAKKPGPVYWGGKKNQTLRHYPNPQASQLPLLESHLKDIRHEKDQIRKQLEKAQR
jgi:hypothetical protein